MGRTKDAIWLDDCQAPTRGMLGRNAPARAGASKTIDVGSVILWSLGAEGGTRTHMPEGTRF